MFEGRGHVFCGLVGAAVGEGFFVADGYHARMEVGWGREFKVFGGKGRQVAFSDLEVPVYKTMSVSESIAEGGRREGLVLVLTAPPALAEEVSGCLAWRARRYSCLDRAMDISRGSMICPWNRRLNCQRLPVHLQRDLLCASDPRFPPDCRRHASVLTSATSLILLRSLAGRLITSRLSFCSASSPTKGLERRAGLSLAETQGATPWSGTSRRTFP